MIKLDRNKNLLTISIQYKSASPGEVLMYYQDALIAVLKRAILYSRGCDMCEEEVESLVDVLDLLKQTLPDEMQMKRLELSPPELLLELKENLSKLDKERIKDLEEIRRLKAELEIDDGQKNKPSEDKKD